MARQIEDITVKLGITGFEELNKLRSSFRELTKVTNATDAQLDDARKRLLELKTELGNTARVNKGLTDAFGALLDEAKRGSDVWKQLNSDLAKVRQEARVTDTQITALRDIIINESKAHAQSANSIREHVKSLQDLRNQASLNGKVHQQLGADIQRLTATLEQGEVANKKHYSSLGQILAVKPDAVLNQWRAYTRILQEGTASAEKLATAQRRLNQLSGAPRILERRRVIESAAITQDPEYLKRFGFEGKSLPELPNTNAAYTQQIKELQQDLLHLDRNSIQYLQTLMQLAGVQRQSTEVARGYAQALLMGVQTKTVANSTRNLQEVITALRAEMQQLDTTTSEGSAAYATNANQVRNLEQQLKNLAGAYRHVGDMATQAATAEQNAANARIRDNYLNRGMVRQQEAALAELGQRVRQGVSGTPLLLPAAGQTTAPGTGLAVSGGARIGRATGNIQQIFAPGSGVGGVRFPGEQERLQPVATPEEADRARRAYISESAARRANAEAIEQQKQRMENLRAAVDKATKANTGSINSLGNLREALSNLRNEIPATNGEFKQLTARLQDVDVRSERLSVRASRRLTGMQLAQGVGAALSGGIFGGPEGLIGGLGGLAVGGVGGAFAGAAAGAQVGMFRQQLGAVTEYSARIDKLQIALRGIVGSQAAYSQALAAAASVTRDLNIPQETAIQGMTRLSAAVQGAGGTVNDSAFAFRAISEAVKATGGDAEQADGALLALTQVFSKGKVSAEELNQIAERLPGTFTLFAKAAGKSGPELQKALQQGQVGLNDLMKFLQLISSNYGQTALKIAASSQEAGARLSVAFKNMQLEVGRALQPIGASLQSAFADFITKITPTVVTALKGIAAAFEFLIENKTASGLATFALQLGAVTAGLIALRSAMAAVSAMNLTALFTSTAASAKVTGDVLTTTATSAGGLTGKLTSLRSAVGLLAKSFAAPVILTVGIVGAAVVIDYLNKLNDAKDRLKKAASASRGDTWLTEIGGSATDINTLRKQVQAAGDTYQYLADKIKAARSEQATTPFKPRKEFLQNQIDADLANLKVAESRYQAGIRALGGRLPTAYNPTNFPTAPSDDKDKAREAADRLARERQAAAAEQQRLANTLLDQQLRAADTVFQHQIELDRQRYELQKRLDDAQAQNRILRETGVARDIVSKVEALKSSLREIAERRLTSYQAVQLAYQTRETARVRASYAEQGATTLGGVTYSAPTGSTGGRVRSEAAANALTQQLLGRQVGSLAPAIRRLPTGATTQSIRAIRLGGSAQQEELDYAKAIKADQITAAKIAEETAAAYEKFTLDITQSLREQNATLSDNNDLQKLRNRLSSEGVSPERINLEVQLSEVRRDQLRAEQAYLDSINNPLVDPERARASLEAQNQLFQDRIRLLTDAYNAQETYNRSVGGGFRDGAASYVQSIGTMREATAQLAQTGIKGVEDAIFSLVTTGTANFREFAASILRDTARMIIQQLILRSVMQIIGAIGGGGGSATAKSFEMPNAAFIPSGGFKFNAMGAAYAANGIVPYAMGGVVKRPTMFAFASGGAGRLGLMGEAGPEAIMPLRRLPSGRLGVESAGGGTTNVVVNVDASGSQVQGDAGRGEQLGRAVSAAVQAELIKQKRPGGLLS